jgi:heme-degrading monooxygenase HmoA
MLWRPNGRGLQSTPLKRSKDLLEYHSVLLFTISRSRGISTTWSLSPLHFDYHKEARSKEGMSNAHKSQRSDQQHAHKSQQELTTQPDEFTTQIEL